MSRRKPTFDPHDRQRIFPFHEVKPVINHGYTYVDRITQASSGMTILQYYAQKYTHSSRAEWQEHFRTGRMFCNGKAAGEELVLQAGDRLEYRRPPWEEPGVPKDIPVLDETSDWMVFAKPSGIPVLPGGGYLMNTMVHILRERHGRALAPVHRLGRGTSGAILFSRSATAAARLGAAMRERRIEKTYLAIVAGQPPEDAFTIEAPIGRVAHPLLGSVHAATEAGKPSVSHFRVLRRDAGESSSVVEVRIPTGRPHQIRIHAAAAGFPLAGDPLYGVGGVPLIPETGRAAVPGDCGYTLHSWKIRFPESTDGTDRLVIAPLTNTLAQYAGIT